MPQTDYSEYQEKIRTVIEDLTKKLGEETEFSQRESKLTATIFCQAMILGGLKEKQPSLNTYAQICDDLGVEITNSGFDQRINEAASELMKELLGKTLDISTAKEEHQEVLSQFTDVLLSDSSYIKLPAVFYDLFKGIGGGLSAGLKIFLNYSYSQGKINQLEICSGNHSDNSHDIHQASAIKGSLSLFDLGFFTQDVFGKFDEQEAFYLSRYQCQTALYEMNGERFDLIKSLKKSKSGQIDQPVKLGSRVKVPTRLIALRLPKQVAAERRRKLKKAAKEDGRRPTPSAERLIMAGWLIFITNIPVEMLSATQLATLYRLRWQIELVFKVWKSQAHLDEIGAYRRHRVLSEFYARLIVVVLFHFLIGGKYALNKRISLFKAFAVMKRLANKLTKIFSGNWDDFPQFCCQFERLVDRFAMQDKRKKKPSTYQLLVDLGV